MNNKELTIFSWKVTFYKNLLFVALFIVVANPAASAQHTVASANVYSKERIAIRKVQKQLEQKNNVRMSYVDKVNSYFTIIDDVPKAIQNDEISSHHDAVNLLNKLRSFYGLKPNETLKIVGTRRIGDEIDYGFRQ